MNRSRSDLWLSKLAQLAKTTRPRFWTEQSLKKKKKTILRFWQHSNTSLDLLWADRIDLNTALLLQRENISASSCTPYRLSLLHTFVVYNSPGKQWYLNLVVLANRAFSSLHVSQLHSCPLSYTHMRVAVCASSGSYHLTKFSPPLAIEVNVKSLATSRVGFVIVLLILLCPYPTDTHIFYI